MEYIPQPKRSTRCIQILSIGDAEVGKSCIIKRLGEKRFVSKYFPTVGVDYGAVKVNLGNQELRVNIFDLSGHPYFHDVRNEFYGEVHGIILVYDVSNPATFESLDGWFKELTDQLGAVKALANIVGIVCANKCERKHAVQESFARMWAELHGFLYLETSALSGAGVSEMFEMLFTNIVKMLEGQAVPRPSCHYTKEQVQAIHKLRSARDNFHKLGLTAAASRSPSRSKCEEVGSPAAPRQE